MIHANFTFCPDCGVEKRECPFLNTKGLVVKSCPKCKKIYPRPEKYCYDCVYAKGGKRHTKGSHFELIEKLSNNPTCENLGAFKKRGDNGQGES